ncbi:MAG: hypothetical protein Devi2KO_27510 [Devosia indica]
MTIHPKFPQWYATFQIQKNDERLSARSDAIVAYIEGDEVDVETLLALALNLKRGIGDSEVASFREAFVATDAGFPDDNPREIQVLAAAALATILVDNGDPASHAALCTATTMLCGSRSAELPMNLADLSAEALERIAEHNSTRPKLGSITPPPLPNRDHSAALAKVSAGEADAMAGLITQVTAGFRKDLNAQRDHQQAVLGAMEKFVTVQDEELQILWWLVGGRSKLLDVNFDKVPVDDRPFLLAMELAELTQTLPGPASLRGLLSRAGVSGKKVSIAGAMTSAYDTLRRANKRTPSSVCHPLHFAIGRMEEFEGSEGWAAGWAAACGIKGDATLSQIDLAELFYREELLLKHFG